MILNAALSRKKLMQDTELITQEKLLASVAKWKQNAEAGEIGLEELQKIVMRTCKVFELGLARVGIKWILEGGKKEGDQVRKDLRRFEKDPGFFIISNFEQKCFTADPDGDIGHYAPVGAFDENGNRVLILDPDREYYEPYWVSVEDFMKGMIVNKAGYLTVKLRA